MNIFINELLSGVCVAITFQRRIFNRFISNYIPSLLLVVVSFGPFLMKAAATIDRIDVSVTLLLAIFTVFAQVHR